MYICIYIYKHIARIFVYSCIISNRSDGLNSPQQPDISNKQQPLSKCISERLRC